MCLLSKNSFREVALNPGWILESLGEIGEHLDVWAPPSEVVLSLDRGGAWVPGVFEALWMIGKCSQDWAPLSQGEAHRRVNGSDRWVHHSLHHPMCSGSPQIARVRRRFAEKVKCEGASLQACLTKVCPRGVCSHHAALTHSYPGGPVPDGNFGKAWAS